METEGLLTNNQVKAKARSFFNNNK